MSHSRERRQGWSIARYAIMWILAGAITAAVLVVALRGFRDDELPPLERTELSDAVRDGRCMVRSATDRDPGNPPAAGRVSGHAAAAAVYDRSPAIADLLAAVRHGTIVISYQAPLGADGLDQLKSVQSAVPKATIVTPNSTGMPYRIAAVAWKRQIGCRRFSTAALEAIRIFRAHNLGRGPDTAP